MVYIGAHISREKTLIETLNKIKENGGNALQIFVSNPRSIQVRKLNEKFINDTKEIKNYLNINDFKLVIHSPYTINISNVGTLGIMGLNLIIHELIIANDIGAVGCVIHVGKYKDNKEIAILNMKSNITFIINKIIELKLNSKLIIETSSGQGNELLFYYQEFLDFYNSFSSKQKKYLKICIDTCHVWASGYRLMDIYEITNKNKNLNDISVIQINNSKNPINSHLDRHNPIRTGYIPVQEIIKFTEVLKKENPNVIVILETPGVKLKNELRLINNSYI